MENMGFWCGIRDFSFSPSHIANLIVGDWIVFENLGKSIHNIVYNDFVSPDLIPGEMFQYTMKNSGEFKITCGKHDNEFLMVKVEDQFQPADPSQL